MGWVCELGAAEAWVGGVDVVVVVASGGGCEFGEEFGKGASFVACLVCMFGVVAWL